MDETLSIISDHFTGFEKRANVPRSMNLKAKKGLERKPENLA